MRKQRLPAPYDKVEPSRSAMLSLGKKISGLKKRDDLYDLLPGCGVFDGGCLLLALALQKWSNGTLASITMTDPRGRPDHAIVYAHMEHGRYYIDGDGVACDEQEMISRFRKNESVKYPLSIVYASVETLGVETDIPGDPDMVDNLVSYLGKTLGKWEDVMKLPAELKPPRHRPY